MDPGSATPISMLVSPSTRRAWIEIAGARCRLLWGLPSPSTRRAWIEIGLRRHDESIVESPSTRRAWIEIVERIKLGDMILVALHPEGVDRNRLDAYGGHSRCESPSTRRAWIEM